MRLRRGVVVISFDFELIWGTLDHRGPEGFRHACEREREQVIDRLLGALEEFRIPATWCVLGHLMLAECRPVNGRKHPEIVRPRHAWHPEDWFAHDPCGTEQSDPVFYARSLIESVRACSVRQEIGCHSFSHVIFGDPGCSPETAASEVGRCVEIAEALGIGMRSFAFPRNRVGHLDVLRRYGFSCFRGPEPTWHEGGGGARRQRLGHLIDVVAARRPPVVMPKRAPGGVVNIPASMMYFPMHGVRRFVPLGARVRRATKGIDLAARERRVFHLWCHPTNFADEMDRMFDGFGQILRHISRLRDRGDIDVLTMGALAHAFAAGHETPLEETGDSSGLARAGLPPSSEGPA
jgi:peptidoglycan/xylan/chitin deacetylase (PgdA/CDA1 family)